jgi:hypothetical protein
LAGTSPIELRGRGWTLSVQRLRAAREEGRSPNLGAAATVATRHGRRRHLITRLAPGEKLWLAVEAAEGIPVSARTAAGAVLQDESIGGAAGGRTVHRLEAGDVPLGGGEDPWVVSLTVTVGAVAIPITVLAAEDFDARFGAPTRVEGDPAVYEGWHLP